MYKQSNNPLIAELTKTHRKRQYRLSDLKAIRTETGKACIWCLAALGGNRHKWCSEECIASALAWARPQTAHGLRVLLGRQDNSCAECQLSYRDYLAAALAKVRRWSWVQPTKFTERYMRQFKRLVPREIRPEVDHVIAVVLGGEQIGLDNVRMLCSPCHKVKSKADGKARIALKGNPLKGRPQSESHKKALSESRKGVDTPNRRKARQKIYDAKSQPVIAINVSTGEERLFSSLQECSIVLNLNLSCISRVLRGDQGRTQHKGWKFKL